MRIILLTPNNHICKENNIKSSSRIAPFFFKITSGYPSKHSISEYYIYYIYIFKQVRLRGASKRSVSDLLYILILFDSRKLCIVYYLFCFAFGIENCKRRGTFYSLRSEARFAYKWKMKVEDKKLQNCKAI